MFYPILIIALGVGLSPVIGVVLAAALASILYCTVGVLTIIGELCAAIREAFGALRDIAVRCFKAIVRNPKG
jgi:hypothetical protein